MAFPNTYSSVTYTSPAGAVDISITVPASVGISDIGDQDFYLIDIGSIDFKMDVPSRSDKDVTSIATEQGKLTIKVWDYFVGTTTSIFETLAKLNPNKFLEVEVTVGTVEFLFVLQQGDIKRNEADMITEITFTPKVKFELLEDGETSSSTSGLNISVDSLTTLASLTEYDVYDGGSPTTFDCISALDLVETTLMHIYGQTLGGSNSVIATPTVSHLDSGDGATGAMLREPSSLSNEIELWVLSNTFFPISALQAVARLGALSGCYFGYAFGNVYFIDRLNTDATINSITTRVELDWSKVLRISTIYNLDPIRKITTTMQVSGSPLDVTGSLSDTTDMNIFSTQEYAISFKAFVGMGVLKPAPTRVDTAGAGAPFTRDDILNNANQSYKKALSFTTPFAIEFEYRGFDELAPYQCFTFNSATPDNIEKPEGASTAGIYRPTTINYDAKTDTMKVKAYLIGNV